ncbi:hypothetical protein GQX74_003582 [Glossina fuscipes]|nr:hypothetical protein GQX74_003582 [Glossina fuscipes]
MPETEYEFITKEWLQSELRAVSASSSLRDAKNLIIMDCRSSHEFSECHIRSAVNFSIPSIMLRRLAAGKIDLLSTIKSSELKERIQNGYKVSLIVLYNDVGVNTGSVTITSTDTNISNLPNDQSSSMDYLGSNNTDLTGSDSTINVLYKRLKQDGCRVVSLQGFYALVYLHFIFETLTRSGALDR